MTKIKFFVYLKLSLIFFFGLVLFAALILLFVGTKYDRIGAAIGLLISYGNTLLGFAIISKGYQRPINEFMALFYGGMIFRFLLIFVTLFNLKQPPEKERADQATKRLENLEKQGIKMRVYWTLGRYDGVAITEAPTEKDAMKAILSFQNLVNTETMVAVPRDEAIKLL